MTSRITRGGLVPGIALLMAAAACTANSGSGDDPTTAESGVNPDVSSITGWTDTCDVMDPDAVTAQLHIEGYTEGPDSLGTNEGDFPGSVKCNSFFDFPAYELPEGYADQEMNGWLYQVVSPYNSAEEAAAAYQTLYDGAAEQLHGRPEEEQVVDEAIEGDWEQGAIFASVGSGNSTRAMYQSGTYVVFIEIGYIPDPGVQYALGRTTTDVFEDPTYEFTPPELAEWLASDYLPGVQESITAKLEG